MKKRYFSIISLLLMLAMLLSACNQQSPAGKNSDENLPIRVTEKPDDTQKQDQPNAETDDADQGSTIDFEDETGSENNEDDPYVESTPEPEPEPVFTRQSKNDTYIYNVYDDAFIEIARYIGRGETHLVIPETIEDLPVKWIADGSISANRTRFENQIKSVTLPDTIEYIGSFSFSGLDSLDEINFPEGLRYIGENAFQYTKLKNVEIPTGIEYIGNEAFDYTPFLSESAEEFIIVADGILLKYTGSDENVVIPDGIKVIGATAFQKNNSIRNVVVPNSVTKIWMGAFFMSSLESISLPDSITEIESSAFHSTKLVEITLPANLKELDHSVFVTCENLAKVTLPKGLRVIGEHAFVGCNSLTEVVIPNGVYKIEDGVFAYCDNLEKAHIPASVKEIGLDPFPRSMTIVAPKDSYAIEFSKENGYDYIER